MIFITQKKLLGNKNQKRDNLNTIQKMRFQDVIKITIENMEAKASEI